MAGENANAADVTKQIGDLTTAVQQLAEAQRSILDSQKSLTESLGKLAAPPAAAQKQDEAAKALTLDDVKNVINETMTAARTGDQQRAAREAYLADKMKDLKPAYRNQLGNDPAKWAAEEQQIRDQYKADLADLGVKPGDVGGNNGGAGAIPPAKTLDLSKLSPTQLIAQGLKDSRPQGAPAQQAAAAAATTAAAK